MARDSRRRRRTRIAAGTCIGDGEPPGTSIHDLPDDHLEQVLLRVRTPVCLFRAAAACKLWRRVIDDDGFLQHVRSLHRPNHLLGHYFAKTKLPEGIVRTIAEFVPFPARPAIDLRQRLSLDFIIDRERMVSSPVLTDSHGGLLAFVHENRNAIVYNPWTTEYKVLELPSEQRVEDQVNREIVGTFILNAGDGDGDKKSSLMSSFSVLCVCLITDLMDNTTKVEACVFSARDDGWVRSTVSSDVYTYEDIMDMDQQFVGRAGGSIFFSGIKIGNYGHHALVVLQEATGDFSTITLPDVPDSFYDFVVDRENLRVVNGVPGTLVRIVRLVEDDLEVLKVTRVHGSWECKIERSVDLCQLANIEFRIDLSWRFLETNMPAGATLVLGAFSPSSTLLFSLDVETMKLQRANKTTTTSSVKRVFPYELPWPQKIN